MNATQIIQVVITSIFVLLLARLILGSNNTAGVIQAGASGATSVINAVVPSKY